MEVFVIHHSKAHRFWYFRFQFFFWGCQLTPTSKISRPLRYFLSRRYRMSVEHRRIAASPSSRIKRLPPRKNPHQPINNGSGRVQNARVNYMTVSLEWMVSIQEPPHHALAAGYNLKLRQTMLPNDVFTTSISSFHSFLRQKSQWSGRGNKIHSGQVGVLRDRALADACTWEVSDAVTSNFTCATTRSSSSCPSFYLLASTEPRAHHQADDLTPCTRFLIPPVTPDNRPNFFSVVQNIHVAFAGSYSASLTEADITFALTSQPDAIFLVVLFPTM
ncbi:hypothetical protein C8R44DRAFT_747364 [Mycena epipterygia]|nr:hypothetical protein C8R44DRAFT_747364 [Mycena epipterygia]